MAKKYRIRPHPWVSLVVMIMAVLFLIGGCAIMNEQGSRAPALFQLMWVTVCLVIIVYHAMNMASETGASVEWIHEDTTGDDDAPAEPTAASQLRELAELRDEGLISEEEFHDRRAAVLSRYGG